MNPDTPREGNIPPTDADILASVLKDHRQAVGPPSFREGFSDRVMSRLAESRDRVMETSSSLPPFNMVLERMFLRMAPLAAAAMLVIAAMNVISTRDSNSPLLDRALGLPTVTLASAYSSNWDILDQNGERQ